MNKRIRNIYISTLRVVALVLFAVPAVLQAQNVSSAVIVDDTLTCIDDVEYQERVYNKSYDSVLVSYFYQRNTKHYGRNKRHC